MSQMPTTADVEAWGTGRGRTMKMFAESWNAAKGTKFTPEQIEEMGIWPGKGAKKTTSSKPRQTRQTSTRATGGGGSQIGSGSRFLSAYMAKAAEAVEAKEDPQSEKIARFQITQRINEERGEIVRMRDEALRVVHAAGMALERLNEIDALNVAGGRSVETLSKILDNPNGNAAAKEDRAEDREVNEAHNLSGETSEEPASELDATTRKRRKAG